MFSSDWFTNVMKVTGSGSLVKFRGPADPTEHAGAGIVGMLRIEFDNERWIVTCPLILRSFSGVGFNIGHALNFEEELAREEVSHKEMLWTLSQCRTGLISIYNKYAETTRPSYCYYSPDNDCLKETSKKLLDRELKIWCDRVPDPVNPIRLLYRSHVDYTLAEVESAYSTKLSQENAYYNEQKSFLEGSRAKYERNWSDP